MNRSFRQVWSAARGAYIIAPETARGNGKASSAVRAVRSAAVLAVAVTAAGVALAQTTPVNVVPTGAGTNTSAYVSANGVPVVNIATANAAGLSHNQFTRYDIDSKGLVLNNSSFKNAPVLQSQLAGQVVGNINLNAQARVILNEVVGTGRSTLAGYTEVLGGKAEVIVANPYGITCSGCGFINSDRVTLTTGVPFLGADGSVGGFKVTGGDILINGGGMNASAQQILDIVTRSVRIEGQLNMAAAGQLGIYTGANQWSYADRAITGALAPTGAAPAYAIDSTALGGMYAGRIRIIATEAGVGVRMLGDASAGNGDFALDAAGKVQVQSRISASTDIALHQSATTGAGQLEISGANGALTALGKIDLHTASGLTLDEGPLKAGTTLSVTAAQLDDRSASKATRSAGGNVDVTIAGNAALSGTTWGAGGHLAIDASGDLAATNATLYSGSSASNADRALTLAAGGNASFTGSKLTSTDTLGASARAGSLALDAGTEATAATSMALNAAAGFDNAAKLLAGADLSLTGAAGMAATNSGLMQAQKKLALGQGNALALQNAASGKLLGETVTVDASTLANAGTVQGTNGVDISATGALSNSAGGLVLSTAAGKDVTIVAASLDNAARLQSAGKLDMNIGGDAVNSGQLLALASADGGTDGAVTLVANSLGNSGLLSSAGTLGIRTVAQVQNSLQVQGARLDIDAGGSIVNSGPDGVLLANSGMTLSGASLDNSGAVQAKNSITATITGSAANSGSIETLAPGSTLALSGASATNSGKLQSAGSASVRTTSGALSNTGQIGAASKLELIAAQALTNSGTALAGADASVRAASVSNSGTLQGTSGLDIDASGDVFNAGTLQSQESTGLLSIDGASINNRGTVQSGGSTALTSTVTETFNSGAVVSAGNIELQSARAISNSGTMQAGVDLHASAAAMANLGKMQVGRSFDATLKGAFVNSGDILALDTAGHADVRGASLNNSGTLETKGAGTLSTTSGDLANSGQLLAGSSLALSSAAGLVNDTTGVASSGGRLVASAVTIDNRGSMQTDGSLSAVAGNTLNNSGLLLSRSAAGGLTLSATSLVSSGTIQAAGSTGLTSTTGAVINSGSVTSGGDLDIQVATALNNVGSGARMIGSEDVRIKGGSGFTINNDGRIQAAADLALGAAGRATSVLSNGGTLFGTELSLYGGNVSNTGRIQAMGSGTVSASSLSNLGSTAVMIFGIDHGNATINVTGGLQNQGALHSGGNLVLNAAYVMNTNTAGISSLADATITTSSSGIDNAGALYAAGKLSTTALNQTITNTSSGTMDATDIAVSAGTFDNYNSVISTNSTGIKTTVAFNNLPTGGVPNVVTDYITYDGYTLPHDSGEYNCNVVGAACDHLWVYAQNYHVVQKLDAPMPTKKGEIIAGNTINIDFGASASNIASLISAPNINITGAGTFTNQDLHLEQIDYARRWRDYKTNSTFGSLNHAYRYATSAAETGNCNDGGCFSGVAGGFDAARDAAYGLETKRTTIQTWRAGIYADNLNFAAGGLQNLGSPYQQATTVTSKSGTSAASGTALAGAGVAGIFGSALTLKGGAAAAAPGSSRGVTVAAANGISFTGLNLTLPTNPNGYFVQVKDPTANYLVETNPLFQVGSNSVGSDYLSKLLGIDPDKQQKRLGDSNYEAKLVRDQLIAQTGNNILKGMRNEAAQMQALMDQATTQSKGLGLVFGQPLSKEQAAGLTEDIVWMVEQTVNGQKVLAPVVYLATSTRDAIESGGPVISATNATIKADTLANTGGTIKGDTLAIETKGDLVNTSGKIKGGDVSVKSTEGSIINQTLAETNGGKDFARTVIGTTGSIESTGNLSLDAAKDITVKGASVKAGGDASLAAGGAVTFDTIQDKSVDSTYKASQGLWGLSSSSESTRTATTTNIGSSLETGGNLKIKSGGDTTIAGSNVKTGGDLDMDAGGNVNIVSRQDTVEKSVSTSHSGLGVGGGLYGATSTTTDSFKGRNVASGIEVGGNANIATDNTMTVQGSKLKVGGDATIAAGDVQVLAGQDVDRTTSVTTTTSFLKISGEGKADSGAGAGSNAGSAASASNKNGKAQATAQAGAGASAGAEASASASAGLTLAETTTTNTYDYKSKAVGSELDIGGNLKIDSKKDITLQGATVNTGGDADLKAKGDVKILASQDIDISTSKTTTTQIGLYVDSDNKASASAEASASAGANASSDRYGSAAGASAQAGARAGAEASSDTNIDLVRTMTTETNSLNVTNTGTTINAGGKLKIDAGKQLAVQGSDIGGEQGVSLKAKDMSFTAAEDISVTTTKTTKTSAGLYLSGSASAEAGASASAGAHASNDAGGTNMGMNASAEAGASAEAKIGAGIQARHSTESSTEGTTTAKVSSIRSGSGDIERNASGKILDVGTAIEAGGDFSQSADTIESRAAKNTTFSSSESQSDSMRLGVYASANAEAKAGASASAEAGSGMLGPGMASNNKSESEAGANAAVGVEAEYKHASSSSSSSSSEAVVSTIKTGGKISSKSTNATVLEGTQISGDGGVELEAKSIDFKAAKNTETSSDSSLDVNVKANVGLNLGSDGVVDGSLGGGFDKGSGSASSSTAVAGSIQSGAGLKIKTTGDARFEGTDIGAAGDASIAAGGKLSFDAARNESSESSKAANAEASISVSKSNSGSGAGLEASGGFENSKSSTSEAVTGKIAAGGNLSLSSGKDMKFEGTAVSAGGDTDITAGGNVDFAAARNTSSSESANASASLSLSTSSGSDKEKGTSEKSKSGAFGAEGGYSTEKSSEAVAGSLETGGNLKIKSGGNATFEGTDIAAGGAAKIDAKGDVNFKAAESTSSSFGVAASIGMEASNTTTTGGKAEAPAAGAAAAAAGPETERERSGSVGFELGSSSTSDKKAATIKAGSVDISSGRNASFEGTKVAADGDINVAAKGDISVTTAKSTSSNTGVSLSGEHASKTNSGNPDAKESSSRAGIGLDIGSSSTNDKASFESGGKLTMASGGKTTLVSTEVKADGGQDIKAGGGVVRSTATDSESGIRMNAVGLSQTKPKEEPAAAAAPAPTAAPAALAATALAGDAPAAAAKTGTAKAQAEDKPAPAAKVVKAAPVPVAKKTNPAKKIATEAKVATEPNKG